MIKDNAYVLSMIEDLSVGNYRYLVMTDSCIMLFESIETVGSACCVAVPVTAKGIEQNKVYEISEVQELLRG